MPSEFLIFGTTLAGVALFHRRAMPIAAAGLAAVIAYKWAFTGFATGAGAAGLAAHFGHEWVVLVNLLLLLVGFALLAAHFEDSGLPREFPAWLPDDWTGAFALLTIVFVVSGFLDNIAAALIGGAMAHTLFRGRVRVGYIAAVVAASNAGGAGSVIGDTTTTMMWIDGVSPLAVFDAYVAAVVATLFFAVFAAKQQHAHQPIMKASPESVHVDWARLAIVFWILVLAIVANVIANLYFKEVLDQFPVIGAAVWVAILAAAPVRQPDWKLLPAAFRGSIFLLALVTCASMMPVEKLPVASWQTALGLGFISAVFDNIPLTALALKQGGYDWGLLAYCVGFGGSMIWFGSSAGVAVSNSFPDAKNVVQWVRHGWHVAVGYVLGFVVFMALVGWHPEPKRVRGAEAPPAATQPGAVSPRPVVQR